MGAIMGTPCEPGAFLCGVPAPWTASVAQGSPMCKIVGSGKTGACGQGMAGHLPSVDSRGSCLAGVSVSESGSCVFVIVLSSWGWLLVSCRPSSRLWHSGCGFPQVWGRPGVSSQEVLLGEKAGQSLEPWSQRSGQSTLSLWSFQQMVSLPFLLQ